MVVAMDAPPDAESPLPPRPLTPEEDSIGEPEGDEDDIDDLLPADLWF
jgi:hypothetical protein